MVHKNTRITWVMLSVRSDGGLELEKVRMRRSFGESAQNGAGPSAKACVGVWRLRRMGRAPVKVAL